MSQQQGNGSGPQKKLSRPSAKEIYVEVAGNARDELRRSVLSLGISGFAGGIFMGFSGLGVAISTALLGPSALALHRADVLSAGVYHRHPWPGTTIYRKHPVSCGALISRAKTLQTHAAPVDNRSSR